MRKGPDLYYVYSDHLGSTYVTTKNDIDEASELYHSFGETRAETGTIPTDKKFTGQILDGSTGVYYYGARYYDSHMGRFIQPDSIVPQPGNPQSLNRYSYTLNNPLRYLDPTGNYVEFVGGMGTGNDLEENKKTWGFLIEQMGLQEGEYGFFDWSIGWTGEGTPSDDRRSDQAAGELARQLSGKSNITLIGHSKGGALVMEYLAQIAEGKIDPNVQVAAAYTIDSPLDPFWGDTRWAGTDRVQNGVDRYANLSSRLGKLDLDYPARPAMAVNVANFDDPEDYPFTSHGPIPGVNYVQLHVMTQARGPFGWSEAHGLLLVDRRVAAYIMYGADALR